MADIKLYYTLGTYSYGTYTWAVVTYANDPSSFGTSNYREGTPESYLTFSKDKIIYEIAEPELFLPEDSTNIFRNMGYGDGATPGSGTATSGDPDKVRVDLSAVRTDYVKNLSYAFYGAQVTEIKGLEEGYMENVEDISYMFAKMPNGVPYGYRSSSSNYTGKIASAVDNCFSKYESVTAYKYIHHISNTSHGSMPNLKTMESLFDGSYNIDYDLIKQMKTWNTGKCSNFSRAFALAGQTAYYTGVISMDFDFSNGTSATSDVNCKQMFYRLNNYGIILLPKTFSNPQIFSDVDYMFFNNLNIDHIFVEGDTNWAENQTILDSTNGYQMFYNCKSIITFDSTKTNVFKANTTDGYFNSINVYEVADSYIKLPSGWRISTPYIKTEDGWKESEVYW